jgi:hypothetical protein
MLKESFMKSMKFGLVAISSLALVLTACPQLPDESGTIPAKYTKLGIVGITNTALGSKAASGSFYKVPKSITQPPTATGGALDTCTVSKFSTTTPAITPPVPGSDQQLTALDAGAELTLKKGTDVLAVLRQGSGAGGPGNLPFYSAIGITVDTVGSTLEIPGATDGFPAMTVTMPAELAAFTFGPKTGVTKDTTFTWTAPTTGAYLVFGASAFVGTDFIFVTCISQDDGSFAFPASTQAEMDTKGFTSGQIPSVTKTISSFQPKGDSLLIVVSTRANNP